MWIIDGVAVVSIVFLLWKLGVCLTWVAEKFLFNRSIRNYRTGDKEQTQKTGDKEQTQKKE